MLVGNKISYFVHFTSEKQFDDIWLKGQPKKLGSNASLNITRNKLTVGSEVLLGVLTGHTSKVESLDTTGLVLFTIATIATDRLTRMAYTMAKPRNPMMPRTVRHLIHPFVSSTGIKYII